MPAMEHIADVFGNQSESTEAVAIAHFTSSCPIASTAKGTQRHAHIKEKIGAWHTPREVATASG